MPLQPLVVLHQLYPPAPPDLTMPQVTDRRTIELKWDTLLDKNMDAQLSPKLKALTCPYDLILYLIQLPKLKIKE